MSRAGGLIAVGTLLFVFGLSFGSMLGTRGVPANTIGIWAIVVLVTGLALAFVIDANRNIWS